MKRIIKAFVLMIAIVFMASCLRDSKVSVKLKSFVGYYIIYDDISLQQIDLRCASVNIQKKQIVSQRGKKKQDERFEELSEKYNDICYNTKITYITVPQLIYVVTPDLKSINVFSSQKFNSSHPKGAKMNDIVRFMSWSLNPFIKSGYKKIFTYSSDAVSEPFEKYTRDDYCLTYSSYLNFNYQTRPCFPTDCLVMNLKNEDLQMLTGFEYAKLGYLYFEELPDVPGDYDIRVEITDENGKVYTSDLTMKFDF